MTFEESKNFTKLNIHTNTEKHQFSRMESYNQSSFLLLQHRTWWEYRLNGHLKQKLIRPEIIKLLKHSKSSWSNRNSIPPSIHQQMNIFVIQQNSHTFAIPSNVDRPRVDGLYAYLNKSDRDICCMHHFSVESKKWKQMCIAKLKQSTNIENKWAVNSRERVEEKEKIGKK